MRSFGIGIVCAVALMGIGWCAVMLTWSASTSVLISAPSRTDRLMVERSAILVAADANMQKAR